MSAGWWLSGFFAGWAAYGWLNRYLRRRSAASASTGGTDDTP